MASVQRRTVFLSFQCRLHVTLYLTGLVLHAKQCRLVSVHSVTVRLELASISIELGLPPKKKGLAANWCRFDLNLVHSSMEVFFQNIKQITPVSNV